MIEKRYEFGGLDLRTKNILRNPQSASDIQNIEFDEQRNIIKRFGYASVDTLANCLQIIPYIEGDTLIAITSGTDAVYKLVAGAWEVVNFGGSVTAPTYTEPVSFVEYGGVIYFSDPSGVNNIMKFDGFMWYRAGLPALTASSGAASGTSFYFRVYQSHVDLQGNVIYSDLTDVGGFAASNPSTTISTQSSTEYYSKWSKGVVGSPFTVDSGNLTVTVTSHNYVAGDYISLLDTVNSVFKAVKVDSVTATTVVFDATSVGADTFQTTSASGSPIENRVSLYPSVSSNINFGYDFTNIQGLPISQENTTQVQGLGSGPIAGTDPLEARYDTTIVKSIPPKARYLAIYNNLMVTGNTAVAVNNVQSASSVIRDEINWSDISVGGSVESFPPFNFEIIGETREGGITGLFGSSDELTVFKKRQVYSLTGLLSLGNYRIRSMLTAGIGCLSHQSIIEASGACLFQGQRGIYIGGTGSTIVELSDKIEGIFTSGLYDLTKTVIVNDVQKEKFYMFLAHATTPASSIVLVWDYYHKEWFKHTGINASGGLAIMPDGSFYHSDGAETFQRSSSYNDDGSAIDALYATAWQDGGEPTLKKKYPMFTAINTPNFPYVLSMAQQINWTNVDVGSIPDITFPLVRDGDEDRKLYAKKLKSMRLIFRNNVLNEGMLLEGYELEITEIQTRFKGD